MIPFVIIASLSAEKYNLPFVQLVGSDGKMTDEVYDMKGVFVKDADKLILPLTKHEVYLKSMRITAVAICALSAAYPLIYLNNLEGSINMSIDMMNDSVRETIYDKIQIKLA